MFGMTLLNRAEFIGKTIKISLFAGLFWLISLIICLLLFSHSLTWYRIIGIILFSLLIFVTIIIVFLFYQLKKLIPPMGWKFITNMVIIKPVINLLIIPYMILIFTSLYFILLADSFSIIQNTAMILVFILAIIVSIGMISKNSIRSLQQLITCPHSSDSRYERQWR